MTEGKQVFVGGLPDSVNDNILRAYFSQYGPISDVQLFTDKATGRSRGFGFITFEDPSTINLVFQTAEHAIEGRAFDVKPAVRKSAAAAAAAAPDSAR
eukprot:CAMPEP_0172196276 /NCGR_PEP_ID=MMETSP1050-20130122/26723_1 /TAXON_ID=233186 /ORGANISM="Cryptomonas curvata, Strain CCAP979/52" /LENGTH=97 /DNA_ID=CAMNT_0012872531 /DNA_START=72 /DNA_END=361 /DNA_ORIENTATION=+